MYIYTVLLINVDSTYESSVKGVFSSFDKAVEYIVEKIRPMLEDDPDYYDHKTPEAFREELYNKWECCPFDIYRINKHTLDN